MIYRVISSTVKPGKMQEARQLALDFAAHVNESYGHKVEVLSNISGSTNRLHVIEHHESLSALEAAREESATDSKGKEIKAKIPDFFESGDEVSLYRVES